MTINKKKLKDRPCVFFVLMFLFFVLAFAAVFAEDINIVILHTNDIHGHVAPHINKKIDTQGGMVGGMAYTAALIEKIRGEYPNAILLLDGGDMYQGDPISNIFHGRVMVDIMNELKYDAAELGNHEFDWGQYVLAKRIGEMKFPVLCANVIKKDGTFFAGARPYIIKEINGVKIAVLGLIIKETPLITMPSNVKGLLFLDPAQTFNGFYPVLKAKGADIIIVLSHMGLDEDKKFASKVKGIDLIVGAHQHIPLHNPVYRKKHGAIITQAGCYGEYLGRMVLCVDKVNKKIKSFTPLEAKCFLTGFTDKDELILIKPSELVPSKKIEQIIARYENSIKSKMEEVVAENKYDLINQKSGKEDTPIGNLICDIMRQEANADISFQNAGGIRESFYKGKIKVKDIYACLPFDNTVATMTLTGEEVARVLNNAFGANRRGIYFSGMKIMYNPRNKEKPVEEIYVEDKKTGKFSPLEALKNYQVATNNFLAAGGDGYEEFKEGKNLTYGKVLRDAVTEYFKKIKIVDYKFETRVKFRG